MPKNMPDGGAVQEQPQGSKLVTNSTLIEALQLIESLVYEGAAYQDRSMRSILDEAIQAVKINADDGHLKMHTVHTAVWFTLNRGETMINATKFALMSAFTRLDSLMDQFDRRLELLGTAGQPSGKRKYEDVSRDDQPPPEDPVKKGSCFKKDELIGKQLAAFGNDIQGLRSDLTSLQERQEADMTEIKLAIRALGQVVAPGVELFPTAGAANSDTRTGAAPTDGNAGTVIDDEVEVSIRFQFRGVVCVPAQGALEETARLGMHSIYNMRTVDKTLTARYYDRILDLFEIRGTLQQGDAVADGPRPKFTRFMRITGEIRQGSANGAIETTRSIIGSDAEYNAWYSRMSEVSCKNAKQYFSAIFSADTALIEEYVTQGCTGESFPKYKHRWFSSALIREPDSEDQEAQGAGHELVCERGTDESCAAFVV